jgi:hypothetical protein
MGEQRDWPFISLADISIQMRMAIRVENNPDIVMCRHASLHQEVCPVDCNPGYFCPASSVDGLVLIGGSIDIYIELCGQGQLSIR